MADTNKKAKQTVHFQQSLCSVICILQRRHKKTGIVSCRRDFVVS